ncbi:AraC family transcriptional regulator [Paenibacillus rigui]|uniref:AraC family transcriptional regulator n=1 Tax=Paenibacillus rigui TaxID=554312 RepID=A0A229UR83_9BACL|nr:helix-turn-helix domain-containing protein [Paenibacillus rigui]OXM85695.1 AraC family transcriptional regulator [Paenibacillus rigui]
MNGSVQKSFPGQPSMGVLNLKGSETKFRLSRYTPSDDIAFFIKHFWIVSWDLTGQEPYLQDVVPNPCVNLVIERDKTAIFGAAKGKFSYLLQGKGCVFGAKFKPGGFYPFLQQPVSELLDKPLDIDRVFDIEARDIERQLLALEHDEAMIRLAEQFIRPKLPARDDTILLIEDIIDRIKEQPDITKVDHLAECLPMHKRKLQRLFEQYVGVSPKWVIKLYRLHHAAEQADQGRVVDWLKLSLDLGYYDQSHFIKDFKTIIGETPEEYARRVGG